MACGMPCVGDTAKKSPGEAQFCIAGLIWPENGAILIVPIIGRQRQIGRVQDRNLDAAIDRRAKRVVDRLLTSSVAHGLLRATVWIVFIGDATGRPRCEQDKQDQSSDEAPTLVA